MWACLRSVREGVLAYCLAGDAEYRCELRVCAAGSSGVADGLPVLVYALFPALMCQPCGE